MITTKINSNTSPRSNLSDWAKFTKPCQRLSKDNLDGFSFSQRESKTSSCDWLVSRIKQVFEKLIAFLRCIFCCKYSNKKEERAADQTETKSFIGSVSTTVESKKPKTTEKTVLTDDLTKQKTIIEQRSTTSLEPGKEKKPEASSKTQEKQDHSKASSIVQRAIEASKTNSTEKEPLAKEESSHNESFGDFTRINSDVRGLIGEYLEYPDSLNFAKTYPELNEKMYKNFLKEIETKEELSFYEISRLIKQLKEFSEIISKPIDDEVGYKIILQHCKNLKKVFFFPFDHELVKLFFLHPPPSVRAIYFDDATITDADLAIIGKICPQLSEIHLVNCASITDEGLRVLTAHCKQLRKIDLFGCKKITNAGVRTLAENCQELRILSLSSCHKVTDEGLQALAANCKQLHELDLSFCYLITDGGMQALATNCKQLQKLRVLKCDLVTNAGVQAIAANCINLQELDLQSSGVNDAIMQVLSANCQQLQRLNLKLCNISDEGLQALVNCKGLKDLDISWSTNVTNEGIKSIATNCKELETLDLSGNNVRDEGLQALSENCSQLKSLFLNASFYITDAGLKAIAKKCKKLETLGIGSSITANITRQGLGEVRMVLPDVNII